MTVLIVDDNAVNRRILHEQATRWHMMPTSVECGASVLETLEAAARDGRPFQLVLLDAHMPGQDGFSVAEQIAARPELAGATIMMLTSAGHYGDAERCRDLRIAAYLTKPVKAAELLGAVCGVLHRTAVPAIGVVSPPAAPWSAAPGFCSLRQRRQSARGGGAPHQAGHEVTVTNGHEALAALERCVRHSADDVQMPEMGASSDGRHPEPRADRRAPAHRRDDRHAMADVASGASRLEWTDIYRLIDKLMLFAVVEQGSLRRPGAKPFCPFGLDCAAEMERLEDVEFSTTSSASSRSACPVAAVKAAIDERDAIGLRAAAHVLKGVAANLSAARLFEAAQTLERLGAESRLEPAEAAWRRLSVEAANVMETLRHLRTAGIVQAIPHENDRDERSAANEGPRRPAPVHV